MPDFRYTAINDKGDISRGDMAAADKHDLAFRLQQMDLFLVSAVNPDEPEATGGAENPAPSVQSAPDAMPEAAISREEPGAIGLAFQQSTGAQRMAMVAMLLMGLLWGFRKILFVPSGSPIPQDPVLAKLSLIKEGMPRKEIEALLTERHGPPEHGRTLYQVTPSVLAVIEYDDFGGVGHRNNRKKGKEIAFVQLSLPRKQPTTLNQN